MIKPSDKRPPKGASKRTPMARRGKSAVDPQAADPFSTSETPEEGERKALEEWGNRRLGDPEPPRSAPVSTDEGEMEPEATEPENRPAVPKARATRSKVPQVRVLSTAEIFAPVPPTAWLVRELQLAAGRPALLYGAAGAGKTIIAQSLALHVAAGLDVWGQFPTRGGRVLHIDYDQGEGATKKRYRRLAAGLGIDYSALGERLRFMPFPPVYLNSGGDIEALLLEHCADTALCVIDALRGALPEADENDSRIGARIGVCGRVAHQTGTVFLLLHHSGKAKDGAGDSPQSPRGSSALLAGAGVSILVTGGKDTPKHVQLIRDSEFFEGGSSTDFTLRFEDEPAKGDIAPLRVVYEGAAPESDADSKRSELARKIVAYIREHDGCTVSDVRAAVRGNAKGVGDTIGALVEGGSLSREGGARGAARLHAIEPEAADESDP